MLCIACTGIVLFCKFPPQYTHTLTPRGNRERPESGIYFKKPSKNTIFNEQPVCITSSKDTFCWCNYLPFVSFNCLIIMKSLIFSSFELMIEQFWLISLHEIIIRCWSSFLSTSSLSPPFCPSITPMATTPSIGLFFTFIVYITWTLFSQDESISLPSFHQVTDGLGSP